MQIPAFLEGHEKKYPCQKENNKLPNFTAKPHLPPKAQEEFHQQQKHCFNWLYSSEAQLGWRKMPAVLLASPPQAAHKLVGCSP